MGWNRTSDYLQEWSRKLKAFNRMVKVKRLFNEKGQQGIFYLDTLGKCKKMNGFLTLFLIQEFERRKNGD